MTDIPVFSECVIGYRVWRIANWVLAPESFGDPWNPGVNRAACRKVTHPEDFHGWLGEYPERKSRHPVPGQDCTCGLHVYYNPPRNRPSTVLGAVAAWGDLQVQANGFRAEYAQIVALSTYCHGQEALAGLAALYEVPVVSPDLLAAEAQRHGSPLPEHLRPEYERPNLNYAQALKQAWNAQTIRQQFYSYPKPGVYRPGG